MFDQLLQILHRRGVYILKQLLMVNYKALPSLPGTPTRLLFKFQSISLLQTLISIETTASIGDDSEHGWEIATEEGLWAF